MDSPDTSTQIPSRVPSTIEIAGLVAAVVPFAVSMASTTMSTTNGEVTSFTYRDPIAIGGGIVAAACGLIALTMLGKTESSKRGLRILIALVLVGGGVFQALRGFGIVGIEKPETSTTSRSVTADYIPPTTEPPAPDMNGAVEATKKIVELWAANKIGEVYELAQPSARTDFDKFDVQLVYDTFTASFGPIQKLGDLEVKSDGDLIRVEGPLVFEKIELSIQVELVREGGQLRWRRLTIPISESQRKAPVDAEGDAYARAAAEAILAKKFDASTFHPRLVDRTPPNIVELLEGKLDELGTIKTIGDPVVRECKEARCVSFPITGSKKNARFDVDLVYVARVWRVIGWNLSDP